jgi:quercetin dioxygenase-like cupin family protein
MKAIATCLGVMITVVAANGTAALGAETGGSVKPLFGAPIPNIPGKSLKTVEVSYPPGAKSSPHRHASSAYIYAYVIEGEIRSQVEGEPVRTYQAGEFWTENPGAHHVVSENASTTAPAKLLAVLIVNTDDTVLTTLDQH